MSIRQLRRKVEKFNDELMAEIYKEFERLARKFKLDEMLFTAYRTTLTRNGKEIKLKSIEALEDFFNETVHPYGFEGYWTKAEGWK